MRMIQCNIYTLFFFFCLAEDFELLGSLLTELQWIVCCIVYGDANELLAYYKECRTKVPVNVSETCTLFFLLL